MSARMSIVTDELEALESILIEDFAIMYEEGIPRKIETIVHPSTGDQTDQQYVCIKLVIKLSPDYPDTSPEVLLTNPRGLDDTIVSTIHSKIQEKLDRHVGSPLVFDMIEIVRDYLTKCNLPSGQCVICLYNFVNGDVFIKTPCYHHFHSHCLSKHLINSEKYHKEEMDKLPRWQRADAAPYRQTCPVCRCDISFDEKTLEQAPPPVESIDAPPFHLTDELKALQARMAEQLAHQIARGGVVGMGDVGPKLLTISTVADKDKDSEEGKSPKHGVKAAKTEAKPSTSADAAPETERQPYRGPYRGFNRRGKPGRRGRGAQR